MAKVEANGSHGHARASSHLSSVQAHLIAASGEFVGTLFYLYFSYAGHLMAVSQVDSQANAGGFSNTTVFLITLAYSGSILINVWAFYRISGGLFNPAVTLGMCLAGQLKWLRAAFLVPAQILGCMCAGGLVSCMFPGDVARTNTLLTTGTTIAQGVFIEAFLTAQLMFVVLMLAAEKSKDTFIAPFGVGIAVFVALLPAVNYTGGSLNPVRSFGSAVASTQFPGYHWIYWVGPALGAAVAAGYYRFVKYFHYEEANPGQDSAGGDFSVRV